MKNLFFVLLVLTAVFSGCKKDDPVPDKVKFIGNYHGTLLLNYYFDNKLSSTKTIAITETIDNTFPDSEILIGANSINEMKAMVAGNNISIYNQPVFMDNGEGVMIPCTASGYGGISNNVVNLQYDSTGTYLGYSFKYEFTEIISKN